MISSYDNGPVDISVARVWKRDRSVNYMGYDIAAHNLKSYAADPYVRHGKHRDISNRLRDGEVFETAHAWILRADKTREIPVEEEVAA